MRRKWVRVPGCITIAATAPAFAAAASYELDYQAEPGCPDREAFVDQISARSAGARPDDDSANRRFVVRIVRSDSEWRGEIGLRPSQAGRSVSGKTCESVTEALALIAAVALDEADAREVPQHPPVVKVTEPPGERARVPIPADSVRRTEGNDLLAVVGFGGMIASGPAPAPLYGVRVGGELGLDGRTGPTLRIGATLATTGNADLGAGAARFVLATGSLGACPGSLEAGAFLVTACLDVEAGRIEAEGIRGDGLEDTSQSRRFWMDVGPTGRLSWRFGGSLRLDLSGGVSVAATRRTYVFEGPRDVVHEPPLLVARAAAGLSAELP